MRRTLLFLLLVANIGFTYGQNSHTKVKTTKAVAYAKTAPLSELTAKLSPDKQDALPITKEVKNKFNVEKWVNTDKTARPAPIQKTMGGVKSRGPEVGFSGQGGTGFVPPDTDGDVNDTHFVQMVNSKYNVYLKDGTHLLGPLDLSTLWAQLPGGPWGNSGDPIVLYDEEYDRWILTQFAPRDNYSENYELFAVSETSDPTGAYFLYAFEFGTVFNDYPKMGVWNDGYYATYNMFQRDGNSFYFVGASITAVEREKMVVGDPDAQMIVTPGFSQGYISGYYATMPADVDGEDFPEAGTPCPVMFINEDQEIEFWNFTADWENPDNSTLIKQNPNVVVSSFQETPSNYNGSEGFIPQPGTSSRLDGLGRMIMNRLAYRKFDDHESMVVNHSVMAGDFSGIRWYEFRRPNGNWELFQEGTYAPDDGVHRWMGSIAMNGNGDIAIGYSVSNAEDIYPSIRYTGRRVTDPLGEMTMEEIELKTGSYSQSHYRWGDYNCMNVDTENDTSFWYTTEHSGWGTWIAKFDFGPIQSATADAGEDGYICVNEQFQTAGSGTNVHNILWTTDGDGVFSPHNQFNTTYIRGNQDIANGGCTLTMTVTGFDGVEDSDQIYLHIVPWADAGPDAAILSSQSLQLQGQGTEYGDVLWTTSGDGTFSNANSFTPIYTPGAQDISNAGAELSMSVSVSEPCEDEKEDSMILDIIVGVEEIDALQSFTVSPNPSDDVFNLEMNETSIGQNFTILIHTGYGKEIYREVITAKSNTFKKSLDMSQFVAGIYFASFQSENGTKTIKLIKK
jgi:hypothetical protein